MHNTPDLWRALLPVKTEDSHKYTHGHAVIYGAPDLTGATRLAAAACARMGVGLVTVLAPAASAGIYRTTLPAHLLVRSELSYMDKRVTARLYGCGGLAVNPDFGLEIPTVLDADALNQLPSELSPNYVLTPHDGEYQRIFAQFADGSQREKALHAAQALNVHIVLKGARTIIASPFGNFLENTHASPVLATAGTGDILAGMITGLIAQAMPIFEACAAAVWLHGECARRFGVGLVASDLPELIPKVYQSLID